MDVPTERFSTEAGVSIDLPCLHIWSAVTPPMPETSTMYNVMKKVLSSVAGRCEGPRQD